jgi:alkylation response protein AidB-like acyl-CoA dehydrogenase
VDDYTDEAAAFRTRIKAFLAEHLPAGWSGMGGFSPDERATFIAEWRRTLADNRMLAVAWPTEYGGAGLSQMERVVLAEEFATAGVPAGNDNDIFSIGMIGHTIIEWGTEEQKQHCRASSLAPTFGVRAIASRTRVPTWRRSLRRQNSTVTNGSSTARRCGPLKVTTPTGSSCCVAPSQRW